MTDVSARARLALLLTLAVAPTAFGADCATPALLAQVRAQVDVACPCDVPSAANYRRCTRTELKTLRSSSGLSNACWHDLKTGIAQSTCGRPGYVACCVPAATSPRCRILTGARCTAMGGCASVHTSCADACDAAGCAPPPTTTTTTLPGVCGNGIIEASEACDGGPFCRSDCQLRYPVCCQFPPNGCSFPSGDQFISDSGIYYTCVMSGGAAYLGTEPGPGPAECPASGPCQPVTLPAAVQICCEYGTPSCNDVTSTDGPTLTAFIHACGYGGGTRIVEGSCDAGSGKCTAAH